MQFEAAVWATVAIIAWAASAHFSVANALFEFARQHEEWQLDEFFTLVIFLSLAAFVTSFLQSRRHLRFRRAAERQAFEAARMDVLTGLPNRRMFLELAGAALGEAWRSGNRCSVLFIDLDGFKPVNDTYGHAAGDALLIGVGKRLLQRAPENALVARLGGDEFAMLLPNSERVGADPMHTSQQVLESLQKPFHIAGQKVSINASIGVATGPNSGRRAADLTDAADRAMYMAKRAGRGTVCVFEEGKPCAAPTPWPGHLEKRRA